MKIEMGIGWVPDPHQPGHLKSAWHHDYIAEIERLQTALATERERCAKIAERHGEPYALNSNTGAMMFRAVTSKIAAAIRAATPGETER